MNQGFIKIPISTYILSIGQKFKSACLLGDLAYALKSKARSKQLTLFRTR